jgi:hypothetical protein
MYFAVVWQHVMSRYGVCTVCHAGQLSPSDTIFMFFIFMFMLYFYLFLIFTYKLCILMVYYVLFVSTNQHTYIKILLQTPLHVLVPLHHLQGALLLRLLKL